MTTLSSARQPQAVNELRGRHGGTTSPAEDAIKAAITDWKAKYLERQLPGPPCERER